MNSPTSLVTLLLPELILVAVASFLFLLGLSNKSGTRRLAPWVAIAALAAVFVIQLFRVGVITGTTQYDAYGGVARDGLTTYGTVRAADFTQYVKLVTVSIGMLLVLLAWPAGREATGNASLNFGPDAGEFFALMLLSITGVLLVAGANDIMLLFLGIELASIPTYIMVSLSRPLPVAQEAGVKYFFLGAFAAAIMLFGFSYLYGTTGSTNLHEIMRRLHPGPGITRITLDPWQSLAVLMLVVGFAFKMAAVPLHFYAGDVYQGAATPVTAFLSFIPKASGFAALIKLLFAVGGPFWLLPEPLVRPNGTGLLWILAILTMTFGNVLGLLQYNVKRVMAYSSIAHTGYMLAALAAVGAGQYAGPTDIASNGVAAVLFYLTAYGITNIGAFGVLELLPAKDGRSSAETFEDLAGQGRRHVGLGLSMAVCCFSLTGIPLTVGFLGKLMIIKPALAAVQAANTPAAQAIHTSMTWLVIFVMLNAAISAAYYLRIVATLFLRTEEHPHPGAIPPSAAFAHGSTPITLAVFFSIFGTLLFGIVPQATDALGGNAVNAAQLESWYPLPPPPTQPATTAPATTTPSVATTR
jgi:NADH-quinone oxidoreductase subunit N